MTKQKPINTDVESEISWQVMSRLADHPEVSQRDLAAELGVSLGSVNYCMKALISKGFVKAENFRNSSNNLSYSYLLTPSGMRQKARLTVSFLKRKQLEYSRLEQEIADLRAQVARMQKDEPQ